jgi:hypothetical protein
MAEHEKKIGRHLMGMEHKFDNKFISINKDLIDIKRVTGPQPRLEDELRDLKSELKVSDTVASTHILLAIHLMYFVVQDMRSLLWTNTQSASKDVYVKVITMTQHIDHMNQFLNIDQLSVVGTTQSTQ